jgi:hypothetical protein
VGHRSETTNLRVADVEDRMLKARTERQGISLSDVIRQYLRRAFIETLRQKNEEEMWGPRRCNPAGPRGRNPNRASSDLINVAQFSDELPTKPCESFPMRVLVRAHQIDRLAEAALNALRTSQDSEAIAIACAAIVQVQALAAEMAR